MLASLKLCLKSQFKKILERFKFAKESKKPSSDSRWVDSFSPSMEISGQLKHVFKLIDSNGDGKISPLELTQLLLNMGHEKAMAAKEAEIMVKEMDCDGDGYVDFEEFMTAMESDQKQDDGVFKGSSDQTILEAFRVFDADNNGLISAKELKRVLERICCGTYSVRECKNMIKGVDKDGDGYVNFEEFKCMMSSGCYATIN